MAVAWSRRGRGAGVLSSCPGGPEAGSHLWGLAPRRGRDTWSGVWLPGTKAAKQPKRPLSLLPPLPAAAPGSAPSEGMTACGGISCGGSTESPLSDSKGKMIQPLEGEIPGLWLSRWASPSLQQRQRSPIQPPRSLLPRRARAGIGISGPGAPHRSLLIGLGWFRAEGGPWAAGKQAAVRTSSPHARGHGDQGGDPGPAPPLPNTHTQTRCLCWAPGLARPQQGLSPSLASSAQLPGRPGPHAAKPPSAPHQAEGQPVAKGR